ncbi:MAG TPA: DM13 domain-containing protein [Ilumatobacteraceae bacterium]|nr:DM13 domain-containing protein [Ilumatobacteraceae bacterium]
MTWIRRNLKIVIPVTAIVLAGVLFLAFGVFGVHTLFIDDKVNEAGPVFDSGVAAVAATVEPTSTEPVEPAPTEEPVESTPTDPVDPAPVEEPVVTEAPAPQIVTLAEGTFVPLGRYSGEGTAVVLNDGSAQRFVRFENFSTDNGPDLRVYLTVSDANGDSGAFDDDFVDLGVLKGNIGDQNYEIPTDVDLSVYDTVVVWCVRFSTPFTAADLA